MATAHPAPRSRHRVLGLGNRSLVCAIALLGAACSSLTAQSVTPGLVRSRIEAHAASGRFVAAGEALGASAELHEVYLARGFAPIWLDGGRWRAVADTALVLLREAPTHGLHAADYHLGALENLTQRLVDGSASLADRLDAEFLLTDGLLRYGSHLLLGRVDPTRVDPEWIEHRRVGRVVERFVTALKGDGLRSFVTSAAPAHPEYARLQRGLADLLAIEDRGGWGVLDDGSNLRPDSADARVPALRRRLRMSPDSLERQWASSGNNSNVFDASLARAVKRFQARHGLEVDGVVGRRTRHALNVSATERIHQVEVNLERWRWLPDDLGQRHVRINIPSYEGEFWTEGALVLRSRAIVGRLDRTTPSFTSSIEHLVLAPYWHVPPTIAAVDKLPLIQADPGYVAASRMTLFDAMTRQPIDATTVDWSGISGAEFNRRFRLRQEPGPANALGIVKLVFPNRHTVYVHGTPQTELFARTTRALSSGCVRLEDVLQFAERLLSDQPEWTAARIWQVAAGGVERRVNLREPVPVYLLYFTAFVDPDGTLHLRPDLYQRDERVRSASVAPIPGT